MHAADFGLTSADIADVIVTSELLSEHSGVTHIYLRQRFGGIDVHGAEMNVNVVKDGRVFGVGNSFVPNLSDAIRGTVPAQDAVESATAAAAHLGKAPKNPIAVMHARGGPAREVTLSEGGVSAAPIPARLVYEPLESGEVVLSWLLTIEDPDSSHVWEMSLDASTGELLEQTDLTVHDAWEEPDWAEVAAATAASAAEGESATAEEAADDPIAIVPVPGVPSSGTYRVFAWPYGDPNDGPPSLVVDPADALSSPFGWHDTNGLPGAESNRTVGNNVDAYLDPVNFFSISPVPPTDADRADGGLFRVFDHAIDFTQNPKTYRPAALTNLFYWSNIIHDVAYRYGFNEAAGNFQENQYGRFTPPPGVTNTGANDSVRAEAQDGGGMNNANFFTPRDGSRPRMQMYLWVPQGGYQVQARDGAATGNYNAVRADFGAFLADNGVTQPIAPVVATSPTTACVALVPGSLAGKIAFIEPGGACVNVQKVQNAQNAGAVGVILAFVSGVPATISGTSGAITIPVLGVSGATASLLRPAIPFTAKMAFLGTPAPVRDGDFDAGVIIHEYVHGISNRLTGGRLNVSCLDNNEQMGEGWSDFFGLVLTHDADRPIQRTRGMGPYVRFTGGDGAGIRTTPYSTDMHVNPTTYGTLATNTLSVPHGVGYAWATMLWEVYWNLIDKHGFNENVYEPWDTGGNSLAIQLVMDGMKIQPCSPGFVNGRDAILQADRELTGGANKCSIWKGFAKRGLGFSASQGNANVINDGVEAFDVPVECREPRVSVAPESVVTTQIPNTISMHELTVTNSAPADSLDLSWTITETATDCATPSDLPWLSVSTASGVTAPQVSAGTTVIVDSTGLEVGTYSGKLCVGGTGAATVAVPVSVTVIHDFTGPFSPFGGALNERKAGAAAPVKFSLDGFKGMNILVEGYPVSRQVACDTGAAMGLVEPAIAAGGSSLAYDDATDQYSWVWKTSAAWRSTCRDLIVGLDDGSVYTMRFFFRP